MPQRLLMHHGESASEELAEVLQFGAHHIALQQGPVIQSCGDAAVARLVWLRTNACSILAQVLPEEDLLKATHRIASDDDDLDVLLHVREDHLRKRVVEHHGVTQASNAWRRAAQLEDRIGSFDLRLQWQDIPIHQRIVRRSRKRELDPRVLPQILE
eukprot:CAMPEP_0177308340 /NCGR_PEP_ID=MMETSP0368-20130122/8713_1 /TAXON_ID=447022 ORGANISM="Scrippsiella hangoei-like, Strain SHHI-4" /NCGR_SAMPLE_ID=MMETSP0368 /ASSEMBLY_ACC=CAM_ASM_000363 /LENGTH=156 /DNA_ID=CAMNT_0018767145 /DNA_START=207 /DNA_END=677 /DNA_ORIENTATION=+